MRTFPQRAVDGIAERGIILSTSSREFSCGNLHLNRAMNAGPITWPSANKPIAMPFRIAQGITVYQLGWMNGSGTMTDSADIGIYDTSWNRLVSGGGTARSGVSAVQWVNVTDTNLVAGNYYLAASNNGVTSNNVQRHASWNTPILKLIGIQDSTTNAYPLPDPLTNMTLAATFAWIPVLLIACRVPF